MRNSGRPCKILWEERQERDVLNEMKPRARSSEKSLGRKASGSHHPPFVIITKKAIHVMIDKIVHIPCSASFQASRSHKSSPEY